MSSTTTYEDPRVIDRIERYVSRPPIVRVRTVLYLHDRYEGEEGPPCPCCSSRVCHVVSEIDDLDLLIDRFRGIRVARWRLSEEDQAEYDELAAGPDVEELVLPLRCSRKQLEIITCDAKLVIVTGGSRAGKTQVSQIWLLRRILRDGGAGALYWIMAPDLRAAWIAHGKLLWGTSTADPVLPADRESGDPLLCKRWPDRDRGQNSKDKRTLFLDGSALDLRPLDRKDASRIRGEAISAGVVEEASAVKSSENLIDASNRVVDTGGSILMSTTPDDNEFLEECIASARDEARNEVEDPQTVHFELSRYDNPWLTTASIDRDAEDLKKKAGQAACDRQVHGKWVPRGQGRQWVHFDFDKHVLPVRQTRDIETWTDPTTGDGFLDVTKAAIKKILPPRNPLRRGHQASNFEYIAGLDVNMKPITLVIAKIFARDLHDQDSWGLVIVDEVRLEFADSILNAGEHFQNARGGEYEGITIIVDSTAMYMPQHYRSGQVGQRGSSFAALSLCDLGFDARPAQLTKQSKPVNPPRFDSFLLMSQLMQPDRLFIAGGRAPQLLKSLEYQQTGPSGIPVRVSNTKSDRLANPIDGLRYLIWRMWGRYKKPRRLKHSHGRFTASDRSQ